ncbi:membrane protein FAM174A-like [Mytilus trossulus]|uniref:membrane protein FAM174A-like n=1 Tax=Mytilus trossulus TaxID=6551 RepID=UPI00300743D6
MLPGKFQTLLYFMTLVVIVCHFNVVYGKPEGTNVVNNTISTSLKPSETNSTGECTGTNCTKDKSDGSLLHMFNNKPMLMRAFYVLLAVTSIVIVYFVVRALRIRRKRSKSRKYGLITARGTDMEMAPLDQDDDDDEDMTVYEMNSRKK